MTQQLFLLVSLGCLAAACGDVGGRPGSNESEAAASSAAVPLVRPAAATAPLANGSFVNAAFLRSATGESFVVGAAGVAGLEVFRGDGSRAGGTGGIEVGLVVSVPATEGRAALLIAYDGLASALRGYTLSANGSGFEDVMPDPVPVADEVVGLCHYRSALSSSDFIYAVTDAGMILHYELHGEEGGIAARLLRSVPSSKGSGFCVVDPRDGALYVAEESMGIWRFDAEAETDTDREPVDLRAPFGHLSDDIKGIALQTVDADSAYLLVTDIGHERVSVYRVPDGEIEGHFSVEGLLEPEGMSIGPAGVGADAARLIVIADESLDGGGSDMKFVDWASVESALALKAAAEPSVPRPPIVVRPTFETDVIPTYGDSADDPAIWVDPDDSAQSVVIGTGKKSGLYVFDLEGNTLQEVADGRMNNVDLRDGFELGGERVPLITASNRSNDSIAVYRLDTESKRLIEVADGVLDTGFGDPYGLCMYRSPSSGDFFVFVNEGGSGLTRQWRLADTGNGRVGIDLVREIEVGSQAEGCVADDVNETLYVAEEGIGLWKYSAEPGGGNERTAIDSTDESGRLTADVEGVALYARDDGTGYLVASNQGADNYAVYRREGDNEFLGIFHIVANAAAGIDGASETDGLDVSSAALGSRFPDGLLVVQDGRNIAPEERQNFKYVSWTDIAAALGID